MRLNSVATWKILWCMFLERIINVVTIASIGQEGVLNAKFDCVSYDAIERGICENRISYARCSMTACDGCFSCESINS